jgi:hypothetical protein
LAGSVAAIGLAGGCSSNAPKVSTDPTKARLVGKITKQGKPFPGYILVQSEDKSCTAQASFARDGSYVVTDVPIGKVKLALLPPSNIRRRGGGGQDSELNRLIPPQYNNPSTSGLTVEIHSGRTEYSLDLP